MKDVMAQTPWMNKRTRERNTNGNMIGAGASKKVRCKFMVK
jgi:hypothetical protein